MRGIVSHDWATDFRKVEEKIQCYFQLQDT